MPGRPKIGTIRVQLDSPSKNLYCKKKRTKTNEGMNEKRKALLQQRSVLHSMRFHVVTTGKLLTSESADGNALKTGLVEDMVVEDWF